MLELGILVSFQKRTIHLIDDLLLGDDSLTPFLSLITLEMLLDISANAQRYLDGR